MMDCMFQSAPRSRDRGDLWWPRRIWPSTCFNPRPGHVTGATNLLRLGREYDFVSIRAPVT